MSIKICPLCHTVSGEDEECPRCSGRDRVLDQPDPVTMPRFQLKVIGKFETFKNWVDTAQHAIGDMEPSAICVDSKGRHCTRGAHMHRAERDNAFPVYYGNEFEVAH